MTFAFSRSKYSICSCFFTVLFHDPLFKLSQAGIIPAHETGLDGTFFTDQKVAGNVLHLILIKNFTRGV